MKVVVYGCSFSKYNWPTYADILQSDKRLNMDVINNGRAGAGNDYIFYNVMQDFHDKKLDDADVIIVQWSSILRFNYLSANDDWVGLDGCLINSTKYTKFWNSMRKWYNTDYEYNKNINYAVSAKYTLDSLPAKKIYLSFWDYKEDFILVNDIQERYKGTYFFDNVPGRNKRDKFSWTDTHPTVLSHLDIAEIITKELGMEIQDKIKRKCENLDKLIHTKNTFKHYFL